MKTNINHPKTLVIITGGTIEGLYNPEEGTPYYVPLPEKPEDSAIPGAFEKLGLREQVDFYPLCMRDSKDVHNSTLDHIIAMLAESDYKQVIIAHGTDTMPLHARYIKRRMAEYGSQYEMDKKKIIFTGAMGPLCDANGKWRDPETKTLQNDGWQNLKKALQDVREVPPGVYLEMGNDPEIGQGPWEADTVSKYVKSDRPDSRAAKVTHSGFVKEDPSKFRPVSLD